jgi:tetratricopeptide (TPR) repeat protein
MGLFDIFRKNENNSPAKDDLTKAKKLFVKGEFQETLGALAWGFKKDVNYKPLYKLSAESLEKLNAPEEQELFEAVNRNINDSDAFNNLGNFYFGIGYYDLAQVFFEKAIELNTNNEEAPHDLAICYARQFQVSKAVEVLTNAKSSNFWDMYFLNKCKILDKKIDGVQESVNSLKIFLDELPDQEDLEIPKMKIAELQEILQRFNTVPALKTHIRDWHYIQYGAVILDYFEDGGDDDDFVAGGRYVASWGSNESLKTVVNKFKQFAGKLSISFQKVVSFSDRDSEILGRLFAKELSLDFDLYKPEDSNQDCLIVSSSSTYFTEHEELSRVKDGQILLSVNHSWLESSHISPDVIGFMAQSYSFPWSGDGMRITDMESRKIEMIPPDNRSAEEIATDIFNIDLPEDDINEHLEFYAERKQYLKGIGSQTNNYRYNFMIESPVAGAHFG